MKFDSDITTFIDKLKDDQRERFKELVIAFDKEGLRDDGTFYGSGDFTMQDVVQAIDSVISFDRRRVEADAAVKENRSTIPKERWGVHETHCCKDHGCKYGDIDCPVATGLTKQVYPCEDCDD